MNNTVLLIKVQFINSLGINKLLKGSTGKEKVKSVLFVGLMFFVAVMVFIQMSAYAWIISDFLQKYKAMEVLIITGTALSLLVCLFMSIYKASGYLFAFKDFDLLMSLPLPVKAILTAKLFMLALSNMGLSVLLGFPYFMVFGIRTSAGALFYLLSVILLVLSSLLPLTIGSVISLGLGRVSGKSKRTNAIMIAGSFLLLLLFMLGMLSINSLTPANLKDIAGSIESLKMAYYPFGLITRALTELNLTALLLFCGISIAVFAVFVLLFSRSFKATNAKMQEKYKTSDFKMTELRVQSIPRALFKKELSHYFSSYIYVLNTGFGAVMMLLAAVMFIINREKLPQMLSVFPVKMSEAFLVTLAMAACVSLTCTTAPSISLEGRNLWIIRTLPLKVQDIFIGKICLNLVVAVPAMFLSTTVLAAVFRLSVWEYLLSVGIGCAYSILMAVTGLIINLHFPKLDWNTQTVAVKQSASVMLTIFTGFLAVIIPIVLLVLLKPADIIVFQLLWLAAAVLADFCAYRYLSRKGAALFRAL